MFCWASPFYCLTSRGFSSLSGFQKPPNSKIFCCCDLSRDKLVRESLQRHCTRFWKDYGSEGWHAACLASDQEDESTENWGRCRVEPCQGQHSPKIQVAHTASSSFMNYTMINTSNVCTINLDKEKNSWKQVDWSTCLDLRGFCL